MHAAQRQDELMLSEAFHEGVKQVRRRLGPGTPLQIINFDWHGMMKDLKEKESVRCMWEHLQGLLPRTDLSSGTMEPVSEHIRGAPSDRSTQQPKLHIVCVCVCMCVCVCVCVVSLACLESALWST